MAAEPSEATLDNSPPEEAVAAATNKSSSLLHAPATYLLLGINLLVFVAMQVHGPLPELWHAHQYRGILTASFDFETLRRFGGSETQMLLEGGEWWRLLTAIFIHVTLLHLLVNLWCLWNLGLLGEPLLGREGLLLTYVLTGIAGNLGSLAVNAALRQNALVAGASGAVFGIAGILIVLLSNRRLSLPWAELRALRRSVILFAVLNLALGIAPQILLRTVPVGLLQRAPSELTDLSRIDNTAHLGGFLFGLLLGLPLFPRMMSGRVSYRQRQRWTFAAAALLLALFAYGLVQFAERPGREPGQKEGDLMRSPGGPVQDAAAWRCLAG